MNCIGRSSGFAQGVSGRRIRVSDKGIVPATCYSPAGYRRYDVHAPARLELVRTLRELDIDLAAVRRILSWETSLGESGGGPRGCARCADLDAAAAKPVVDRLAGQYDETFGRPDVNRLRHWISEWLEVAGAGTGVHLVRPGASRLSAGRRRIGVRGLTCGDTAAAGRPPRWFNNRRVVSAGFPENRRRGTNGIAELLRPVGFRPLRDSRRRSVCEFVCEVRASS